MKNMQENYPDTNVIVKYLVKDNIDHYNLANAFFEKIKDGSAKAVILESVIAECVYVLTKIYKVPKNLAAENLISMLCQLC